MEAELIIVKNLEKRIRDLLDKKRVEKLAWNERKITLVLEGYNYEQINEEKQKTNIALLKRMLANLRSNRFYHLKKYKKNQHVCTDESTEENS